MEQINNLEFSSTKLAEYLHRTGEVLIPLAVASRETKDEARKKENDSNH